MGSGEWRRFAAAATQRPSEGQSAAVGRLREPPAAGSFRASAAQTLGRLRERSRRSAVSEVPSAPAGGRLDLRLLPAAALSWVAAWSGVRLTGAGAADVGLIAAGIGVLLASAAIRAGSRAGRAAVLLPVALCLLCTAAVMLSAGVQGSLRTRGPVRAAIANSESVTAVLIVQQGPRAVPAGQIQPRPAGVVIEALLVEATSRGQRFQAAAPVVVLGGPDWARVKAGDQIAAAGRLGRTPPGQDASAYFAALTGPRVIGEGEGWNRQAEEVRSAWRAACGWLWPDAAGLLPGMITGDRTAMPGDLAAAMRTVGLTHLTAVSGANCTLVLGGLLYLARCLRAPRGLAAAAACAGLAGFVTVVGPDPSVLRAALMGLIGVLAMLCGRPRRIPALLAVTVVTLLALDPWLAADYAFVLSVVATIGLVLLGQRCSRWLAQWLPHWLAKAIAVPLAAQLCCAPVLVLLQPQLMLYALPANVAAAPAAVVVTLVGTLGLLATLWMPCIVPLFVAVAGAGSAWVAGVARFFSGLPGAALPWPEGSTGVALMGVLSGAFLLVLWGAVSRSRVGELAEALRARLPPGLAGVVGLPAAVMVALGLGAVVAWALADGGML